MIEKIYIFYTRINIRTKLFFIFFTLLMIVLIMSSYGYYNFALENAVAQYSVDAYQSIRYINTIIDQKFLKIVENSELIIQDRDIYRIFNDIKPRDPYELLKYDRELCRILAKYFDTNEQIYSCNIITSYYTFGNGFLPLDGFVNSKLYQHILNGDGKLIWEPTYDFLEMYNQDTLKDCDIDEFRYLFSCGRVLNIFNNADGTITGLQQGKEYPILLINFKTTFLNEFFYNMVNGDQVYYFIAAPNGSIVTENNEYAKELAFNATWLAEVLNKKTGILLHLKNHENDDITVSCDTSKITGWTLVSVIRNKDFIPQIKNNIFKNTVKLGVLVLMISLILAYFMSIALSEPVKKLMAAIEKTGQGDFSNKIPVRGYGEFDNLIRQFNSMNEKIQKLINENYKVKLQEKQAQISMLNMQINPHFLYNTLNLVNCIAIENRCPEISEIIVSLSRMLHYTVKNNKSTGKLREELEWLDDYIFIMSRRFEDRFDYAYYVEPALMDYEIPRLLLQPFVENAFVTWF